MKIKFSKMNGLGNDFIMIDDMSHNIELDEKQVKWLCDRHFGIGADGVILVRPSKRFECSAYMHYINSDGTLAQMCGNGVRCFTKFLVDNNIVDANSCELIADTMAGPKPISFKRSPDGKMEMATVQMGQPILDPKAIPVDASTDSISATGEPFIGYMNLASPWGDFSFACVSMGNPHAICFIDDWTALPDDAFVDPTNKSLSNFDVDKIGKYFESHAVFPEKSNIEFAEISSDAINMRVYERGCAETLACGTGACAVNVAAVLTKNAPRENDIRLLGGVLHINWQNDGIVAMTGPAEESYVGEVDLEIYDK
ncbi:diaminopimelate epimerase [Adlercreutzia sp. ZJ154]|uniref:diaminopimelate epimerase n=1 Tax=Adlercreutzia sp. ZJ154 TaxID=2709790 RepID=UPI0013ED3E32|nr:diaminopimelate epimerase [Adlercreutzia sp. ZJ154]